MIKTRILKCYIIFTVFISCSSSQKSIVGTYISKKETRFDRFFNSYDYWGTGSTLNLEKDSTFFMKNCGNILEGKWKVENDSLLLFASSNRFVIDSLNEIPKLKEQLKLDENKSISFKLKKRILFKKIVTIEANGDKTILVLKLKKR